MEASPLIGSARQSSMNRPIAAVAAICAVFLAGEAMHPELGWTGDWDWVCELSRLLHSLGGVRADQYGVALAQVLPSQISPARAPTRLCSGR